MLARYFRGLEKSQDYKSIEYGVYGDGSYNHIPKAIFYLLEGDYGSLRSTRLEALHPIIIRVVQDYNAGNLLDTKWEFLHTPLSIFRHLRISDMLMCSNSKP